MKAGVWIPPYRRWVGPDEVRRMAVAAESLGFGSVWVQDHLVAPAGDADAQPVELQSPWLAPDDYGNETFSAVEYYGESNWWLDPYILWGFLAACTERVELGSDVIVLPYRNPVVQAKMLGTVDVLSKGRVLFGVGVGHVPGEFAALGVPYADRGRLMDEYIDVVNTLLSGEPEVSFAGPTVAFGPVRPLVQPVRRPPVLVGGASKPAVRRAVDRGDGWIPAHLSPENLAIGMAYLREYAAAAGRPVPPVTLAVVWGLGSAPGASRRAFRSVAEVTDLIGRYAELGVVRLAVDLPNPSLDVTLAQYELLAQAAAQAGALW
jgi:probable F420-dependent oxidoreductase